MPWPAPPRVSYAVRMDGRNLEIISAAQAAEADNVKRKEQWLREHPRDVIKFAQANRWGSWYECRRDGRQLCEANDLELLLVRLESDFDTPGSREP